MMLRKIKIQVAKELLRLYVDVKKQGRKEDNIRGPCTNLRRRGGDGGGTEPDIAYYCELERPPQRKLLLVQAPAQRQRKIQNHVWVS